jgi:predicted enzyme related to lactoylglutathione lyase
MSEPMATRFGLVLDCVDAERLAEFWTAALGYVNAGRAGSYVALFPQSGDGPKLLLQQVAEPKSVKNRMHLDIETPDITAESARLVALGATRLDSAPCREHGSTWFLMEDPEGNEFCICDAGQPSDTD